MEASHYFAVLSILVTVLGILFACLAAWEWYALRRLRQDLPNLNAQFQREIDAAIRGAHMVISSYNLTDIDARIALLENAVRMYPNAYNAYNTLGYALLDKGEHARAVHAFTRAIALRPQDKAGYCDLAFAFIRGGNTDGALLTLRQAVSIDASASADIKADARFESIASQI